MADLLTTVMRSTWTTEARMKLLMGWDAASGAVLTDAILGNFVARTERELKIKVAICQISWTGIIAAKGDNLEFLIDAAVAQICGILAQPVRALVAKIDKTSDLTRNYDIDFEKLETDCYGEVYTALSKISTYQVPTLHRAETVEQPITYKDIPSNLTGNSNQGLVVLP